MKTKTEFVCNQCGNVSGKWLGRCPDCGAWNSYTEEIVAKKKSAIELSSTKQAIPISQVEITQEERQSTGINELDMVLGGGIVEGSLILVGGDPGIGKSTLLLQVAANLANQGLRILYVSGEESTRQIRLRADRLAIQTDNLLLLSETVFDQIVVTIDKETPDILIVDSIQTMSQSDISSAPGSVSQVREVTAGLMKLAKSRGMATFIVGHVTKAGSIAGPKVLEHIVDTVLYFEGDGSTLHRIVRSVKNRFGSTNEVGLFAMTSQGLMEVSNPSELFVSHLKRSEPGTAIFASIEGTRPLLVELQSLVSRTNFGNPRRMSLGIDYNKLVMSIAILEKKRGLQLFDQDVYVNAVGGIQLNEPALTLPMMLSIVSSFVNKPIPSDTVIVGEVGLLGEIRPVPQLEKRLQEAKKLGYTRAIVPKQAISKLTGLTIRPVDNLNQAIEEVFG